MESPAGEISVSPGRGAVNVSVTSLREARFATVIRQEHDFSCGSAALATLLTHHYGRPTTEKEAFKEMFAHGDQEKIQRYGFSLLDMKRYMQSRGLAADGFRVSLDKLVEVGVPAVTLINTQGYKHFVVVKGLRDGDVLVGDPALGLRTMPRAEFEAQSEGVVFVIRDELEVGQASFDRDEEWLVRRKAPFGTALSRRGLAGYGFSLPGYNEF